jgi:hypothetical protein
MIEAEGVIVEISTSQSRIVRSVGAKAWRVILWLLFTALLAPLALGMWIVGTFTSSKSSPSFLSRVAERVLGHWLGGEIWKPKTVPVHDIRIRETQTGRILLIRVGGHLVAGNFSRGDRITIRGEDHYGTILFREGVNHSIQSRILVK